MKPLAFHIRDFRSIKDSGVCTLSADGITVLAGQNEAGKTAVLTALRDFDLEPGVLPETPEYSPDGRFDAIPTVAVQFEYDPADIFRWLEEGNSKIPPVVTEYLKKNTKLWIERDLLTGRFKFQPQITELWPPMPESSEAPETPQVEDETVTEQETSQTAEEEIETISESEGAQPEGPQLLSAEQFGAFLRTYWPSFVYFDSFQDSLPRAINVNSIQSKSPSTSIKVFRFPQSVPQTVQDFLGLSGLDLARVLSFSTQDKTLTNYLQSCSAEITGDFLSYWKQTVDGEQTVQLQVEHTRDNEGNLKLMFYVHDTVRQYPEQRSKGFLWFLSFYLRLAAWDKREPDRNRLVLIDEPGSYLHSKAQRDVLTLLEAQTLGKNQRFIYTTHSPHLLPSDKPHRIRIVLKRPEEGTVLIQKLTDPILSRGEFSDTLTPILTNIGFDIRDAVPLIGDNNLLVEGISDYAYIVTWLKQFRPDLQDKLRVFPGSGAPSLSTLVSLFIGWGLAFAVLLDHDEMGNAAKQVLSRDFQLIKEQFIQPNHASTIEDLFSQSDFKLLVKEYDNTLNVKEKEKPSNAVKRLGINKLMLARRYGEMISSGELELDRQSEDAIGQLLDQIEKAIGLTFEI